MHSRKVATIARPLFDINALIIATQLIGELTDFFGALERSKAAIKPLTNRLIQRWNARYDWRVAPKQARNTTAAYQTGPRDTQTARTAAPLALKPARLGSARLKSTNDRHD